jgi:hypothetical protein
MSFFSSVVVDEIDVPDIGAIEPEYNAPISGDGNRPKSGKHIIYELINKVYLIETATENKEYLINPGGARELRGRPRARCFETRTSCAPQHEALVLRSEA